MDIRNCQFKFKCSMVWSVFSETSISNIRYWTECDKGVHYCSSDDELRSALNKDGCIFIQVQQKDEDTFETVNQLIEEGDDSFVLPGDLVPEDDLMAPADIVMPVND